MFGFLVRRRRRPQRRRAKSRRIRFETLEARYCLSAPAITALQIDSVVGKTVSLSGHVADENPATVQIDFDQTLNGTASPDASGDFTFTAEADSLGQIRAVAYDEEDLTSDEAYVELTSDEPMLDSVSVTYGTGTEVTITGTVIDESPGGLTVYFSDAVDGTAVTDASGQFTFHAPDGEAVLGDVDIGVNDVWGQYGSDQVELTTDPPELVSMQVQYGAGTAVTITGTVVDESPGGLTVYFSEAVDGMAVTDANGNFTLNVPDGQTSLGDVRIDVLDAWGDYAYEYVSITSDSPYITSLEIQYGYHTEVTITGTVIDEAASGLTVYFSGVVDGTAVTDGDGNFALHVPDGVASLGDVEVHVYDAWGQYGQEWVQIAGDDSPEIESFSASVDADGILIVQGTVADEDPVGLTVVITWRGVDYEVTTDSQGDFVWQIGTSQGEEGYVTTVAYDWWGLESAIEQEYICPFHSGS